VCGRTTSTLPRDTLDTNAANRHRMRGDGVRWRWGLVGLLAGLTLVASLAGPAQAIPLRAAQTTVVMFPWQSDGRLAPQVHVADRRAGMCWVGAFPDINDRYAWRCLTGNFIQTPCFSPMTARPAEVVCDASSPWDSSRALVIQLTKPLPWAEANTGGDWTGWALQLSNKARCILATDTHSPPVSGGPAPYQCANDAWAGELSTGSQPWTVWYGTSGTFGGPASSGVVKVTVAYNGPD
jgi:hypothetical protein